MRQSIKIPRILKINWISELSISVVFNNGESRIIDFIKVLKKVHIEQSITMRNGEKMKVPYEIGADVLLKYSHPEKSELSLKIGELIKEARLKSGLTQQDLAIKSGTSRTYISKIENDRSDLEIATLRKIIEPGLGRKLEISIK